MLPRKMLEIMRTVLPGHFNTARLIANLAQVLYDQGKLAEAEPLFREMLQIRKSVRPAGHPDIQESLNSLGMLLKEQGNTTDAEALLREAVAIGMSPNNPEAAASFVTLAELLTETHRADQAEQVLREALPKALSIFGADDWRIGATHGCWAAPWRLRTNSPAPNPNCWKRSASSQQSNRACQAGTTGASFRSSICTSPGTKRNHTKATRPRPHPGGRSCLPPERHNPSQPPCPRTDPQFVFQIFRQLVRSSSHE